MQSIYNLAKVMIEKDRHDLLYYNILAESCLMTGKNGAVIQLLDDLVRRDVSVETHRYEDDILHRAFCIECFQPIRGIRVKCGDTRYGYSDHEFPLNGHQCSIVTAFIYPAKPPFRQCASLVQQYNRAHKFAGNISSSIIVRCNN